MLNNDLPLQVIKRLLGDLHNVAKSMLPTGKKVQYMINDREYFGKVVFIGGIPGMTRVRVMNLHTLKQRDIGLFQITGLVQEQ
jgi:hypothetical protein